VERTVPSTASEDIELYQRTYFSLLRSSAEVQIRTLEEAHARMGSLLHPAARDTAPDMSAFVYSLLRLPDCMTKVQLVILGQSTSVFARVGLGNVEEWESVSALARRRRCYFDGHDVLACFIASRTDIDDIIPLLCAFQIEWNKIHALLQRLPPGFAFEQADNEAASFEQLAQVLLISVSDLEQLRLLLGSNFDHYLRTIAMRPSHMRVQLLNSSLSEYRRATRIWWENIETRFAELRNRPVYFISSNPHSVVNLIAGYPIQLEDDLIAFLKQPENEELRQEWADIQEANVSSSRENFLYYIFKKFQRSQSLLGNEISTLEHENACGIVRVSSEHIFDVEAQVIDLAGLIPQYIDSRLGDDFSFLAMSNALILNIDYPLGLAAYNILSNVAEQVVEVLGVYVTGKAATLNGVIGDVMIPNVVHDEQSRNTYLFHNAFTAGDVAPFVVYGTVLDNQKAVSVRGTFLQNANYMDVFYREGYTDIEMEAGPYLSAIYEMNRPQRHPIDEVVNLYGIPMDVGILHYASDTPLSKGKNLGAGSLSYWGMDATYGCTLAILRRIFQVEKSRIQDLRNPRE
jgi:Family of unknown function (DUF6909)